MNGFFAIYRRELLSAWVTPIAWGLLVAFLLIQGLSFSLMVSHFANLQQMTLDTGPVQAYFGGSFFLILSLVLICPVLTMAAFAEERRSGTIEALMTAPVSTAGVVLGKYFAVLTTYVILWIPTILYVVILSDTGNVVWQKIAASYLGVFGVGAGYLAIGLFMSALTRSQLLAAVLSVLVVFGLFILGFGEYVFPPGPLRDVSSYISMNAQMAEFSKGVVDLRRIVFDLTVVALPLFLTTRWVESWRWN